MRHPRRVSESIVPILASILCLAVGISAVALPAWATVILPEGVSAYRIAFVTTGSYAGDYTPLSSDIADYNSFVTEQALGSPLEAALSEVGLAPSWYAWGSTRSVDAIDNIRSGGADDLPIYNTQGQLIATGWQQLVGTNPTDLSNPVSFDQYGSLQIAFVLTGTNWNGSSAADGDQCLGCTGVQGGASIALTGAWTQTWSNGQTGFAPLPMYAFSSPIHAVPEAGTLGLLTSALLLPGLMRRLIPQARRASMWPGSAAAVAGVGASNAILCPGCGEPNRRPLGSLSVEVEQR